jgi:hypothetical protein
VATDYSATPAPVDAFSRFQSRTFDEHKIVGVPTMFQRLFGRPGSDTLFTQDAATVEIDIIRNEGEQMARLIERGTIGRTLEGLDHKDLQTTEFASNSRKWTLVEELGSLSPDQLLYRDAGESAFQGKTRQQRMRDRAARINVEAVRRCVRLFEFLCSQSVIYGTMPAILGTSDANMIYDFLRKSTHNFTSSGAWSGASYDIPADFDLAWQLIRIDGHMNCDFTLLGSDAMNNIINNTIVKNRADNRRFELIEVGLGNPVPERFMHLIEGGASARGRMRTPAGHEIWMFTYDDYYTDEAGDPQPYLPVWAAVFGASGTRADRYFGPPERNPIRPSELQEYSEVFGFSPTALPMGVNVKGAGSIIDPAWFYFDFYEPTDKKGITLRTQTAPIFATTQTDAWVTIDTRGGGG